MKSVIILLAFALVCLTPETALANVDVLTSPLQKLLSMVSKAAAVIGGLAVAAAGVAYLFNKDDLSGWVHILARVAIGSAIVVGAAQIVSYLAG